jgi:hypothetical protein
MTVSVANSAFIVSGAQKIGSVSSAWDDAGPAGGWDSEAC